MADQFENHASGLASPAQHAAAVTPNDSTDLTSASRALFVGSAGDISVIMAGGETVTFANASGWMPIRVSRVRATDTTASNIVAVW